jgi:hypothetical protein
MGDTLFLEGSTSSYYPMEGLDEPGNVIFGQEAFKDEIAVVVEEEAFARGRMSHHFTL